VPEQQGSLWSSHRNATKMKKREVLSTELRLLVSMLNLFVKMLLPGVTRSLSKTKIFHKSVECCKKFCCGGN
jgi:hypothetical protein